MERGSKNIKKLEKIGRRSKIVPSPGKNIINSLVSSNAALTASTSTGASYTHEIPDIKVNDNGTLTIPPRSSPGVHGTSDLCLVLSLYVEERGFFSLSFVVTWAPGRRLLLWVLLVFSCSGSLPVACNEVLWYLSQRFYRRLLVRIRTSTLCTFFRLLGRNVLQSARQHILVLVLVLA